MQPHWTGAYPQRHVETITPMAEASNIFPAMEDAVLGARRHCLLSFRVFDPDTRLRSPAMPEDLQTWGDLLAHKTAQGVNVFLLHSDFEPIGAWELHKAAWRNVSVLSDIVKKQGDFANFHAICALHHAEMGRGLTGLFWPVLRYILSRHLKTLQQNGGRESADLRHSPGLWPHLIPHKEKIKAKALPLIRAWPATYHQKLMVVDGETAFIGGLDVDERRYDSPEHDQQPDQTWHDVSTRVTGPIACDIHRHFSDCWSNELENFRNRNLEAHEVEYLPVNPRNLAPCPAAPDTPAASQPVDRPLIRLVRTVSRHNTSPFSFGPSPHIREIEQAHIEAIGEAEDLIYLETQFLRSWPIAEALARTAKKKPRLGLIAVLPAAPEDVAFLAKRGPGEKHGEWLQARALRKIGKAFGARAGFFCLAKRQAWQERAERDAVYGAGIIYCHAKVMLIDDRHAFVTSANLNGRSLAWDTEAGVWWQGPDERIRRFRQDLWSMHLQKDAGELVEAGGISASAAWQRQAGHNATLRPEERQGFILPFPMRKTRRFAARQLIVPDNMV